MYAPVAAPSVLALTIMARAARRETRIQSISVALQAENPMVFAKLAAGEVRRRSCPRPCCPAREVVSRRARRQPAGQRGFSAVCGFVAALAEAGARVECTAVDRPEVRSFCATACCYAIASMYWVVGGCACRAFVLFFGGVWQGMGS